jgi:hypothetical protein
VSFLNRRKIENEVLEAAEALSRRDRSPEAQQLREAAEDVKDHRESEQNSLG